MFNWKKILKWIGIISGLLIVLALVAMNYMMTMYNKDTKVLKSIQKEGVIASVINTQVNEYNLRAVFTESSKSKEHQKGKELLVFIHGAPGSMMDFKTFMLDELILDKYDVVSVDRLGYSGSNTGEMKYFNIELQVKLIAEQLSQFKHKNIVFIGHSYGGPIASLAGLKFKERTKEVIMLAPVLDPNNEKIFWYSALPKYIPFNWILPRSFEVASYEKMAHAKDLKSIEKYWSQIQFPVYHIHGKEDGLAPFVNLAYSTNHFNADNFTAIPMEKAGHLLPFLNYDEMRHFILNKELK